MWLASKRRVRDCLFIPFDREVMLVRAFSLAAASLRSWDLFPPVRGYRPYSKSTPKTYLFSAQRQHADWSEAVLDRDGRACQECGSAQNLEAHHLWAQSGFPSLRYVLRNGRTLCRRCHELALIVPEITPDQFLRLTEQQHTINANILAHNFWSNYVGALEKGRLHAYGLHEEGVELSAEEQSWFEEWARLNRLEGRMLEAASLNLPQSPSVMKQLSFPSW